MKKKLIFAAAAIAMLASCSQNDLEAPVVAQSQQGDAIEFGTYVGGAATSRTTGGATGNIITNATLQSKGFGVFAYYTGTKTYDQTQYFDAATIADDAKLVPNFMWNQQVTYSGGWTYTPIKYWPNEIQNGDVDKQTDPAAQGGSEYGGKVSFFAYAPYVASDNAANGTISGTPDEGITGFSKNTTKGDPIISYKVPSGDFVDLLWGTKGGETGAAIISGGDTGNTGTAENGDGNKHYTEALLTGKSTNTDLTKQELDGKVHFAFQHALAKFGGYEGLQIKVDADALNGGTLNQTVDAGTVTAGTKVTVKSITIVAKAKNSAGDAYYTDQAGTFNLATGEWKINNTTGTPAAQWSYTIDGDKLNKNIKNVAGGWDAQPSRGVYETAQNVYSAADKEVPVIFIPGTRPELTVTVDYVVRTKDTNLSLGYSEVEQVITRIITFGNVVELNKYYKLLIRLGLTEVNFTGTVSAWDDASDGGAGTEIILPLNVE